MRPPWLALLLLAPLLACGDDDREPVGETPPPPAATGGATLETSMAGSTGAPLCACGPDRFCAAEYELGGLEPPPEAFDCRYECLTPSAPGFWCFDDTSCCDGGTCRPDGLCEVPAPPTSDGTSTGDATGPGTSTETGTETGTGSTSTG